MNQHKFNQLLQKFLDGKCTPEEEEILLKWYQEIPLWEEHLQSLETDESIRQRIRARLESDINDQPLRHRLFYQVTRVAASIIIVLGVSALAYFAAQRITNKNSQAVQLVSISNTDKSVKTILLEDGSKISLQPNSELKYPEHFTEVNREVSLSGEAFFEIARDIKHPFIVYAKEVRTKVLGTSFTISAWDNDKDVSVVVRTGKVSVSRVAENDKDVQNEILLTPNQQAVYDRNTQTVALSLVEKPQVVTIPSADMKFVRTPVAEVFYALEKVYGVDIRFDAAKMRNCKITTDLTEEDDLYERIRIICHALRATYTIDKTSIVIDGQGCK